MDQGRNNIPLYYFKLFLIIFSTQSSLRSSGGGKQGSYKNNHYLSSSTITMMCEDNENRKKRVLQEREKILNEWKIIAYPFLISFPYIIATPWWRVCCCCCWPTIVYHYYFFFLALSFFENIMEWMKVPFYCDHKASLLSGMNVINDEDETHIHFFCSTMISFGCLSFWLFFLHEHHQGTIWMATLSTAFISEKKKKKKEILCNLLSLTSHIRAMSSSLLSIEKYCNDVIDTTLNFFDFINLWNKIFLRLEWKNKPIQVSEKSLHVVVE